MSRAGCCCSISTARLPAKSCCPAPAPSLRSAAVRTRRTSGTRSRLRWRRRRCTSSIRRQRTASPSKPQSRRSTRAASRRKRCSRRRRTARACRSSSRQKRTCRSTATIRRCSTATAGSRSRRCRRTARTSRRGSGRGGGGGPPKMRGGSEYGEAWHKGGMLEKKQNVFDDFIAVAEYLIKEKYTSPAKLGIMGGSNGGLLVGAVMEQRPDLFAVALPAVGVMDMLRYDQFTGGKLWTTEYGSSSNPEQFPFLIKYSPLQNIKKGTCYPATLVPTADHDDRVVPSHSFKFTAALQEAQGCDKPVLIRVEVQGSHGYRPTDKLIAERADEWAFAANATGLK